MDDSLYSWMKDSTIKIVSLIRNLSKCSMEKPTFIPTQRLEDEQHGVIYASNIERLFYTFDSNLEPFYH